MREAKLRKSQLMLHGISTLLMHDFLHRECGAQHAVACNHTGGAITGRPGGLQGLDHDVLVR